MYTTDVESRRGSLVVRVSSGASRSLTSSLNPKSYGVERGYSFSRLDGRKRSPFNGRTLLSPVALGRKGSYSLSATHRSRTTHDSPSTCSQREIQVGADGSGLRNPNSHWATALAPHTNSSPLTIKIPTQWTDTSYSSLRYPTFAEISDLYFSATDRAHPKANVSRIATYRLPTDTRRRPRLSSISTSRGATVEVPISPNSRQFKCISPRTSRFPMKKSRDELPLSSIRPGRANKPQDAPSNSEVKFYSIGKKSVTPISPRGIYGISFTSTTASTCETRHDSRRYCSEYHQKPTPRVIIPAKKSAHLSEDGHDTSRDFVKNGRNCRRTSTVESTYSPYHKKCASPSARPLCCTPYPMAKPTSKIDHHATSDIDYDGHPNIIWTNAKMKLREREV